MFGMVFDGVRSSKWDCDLTEEVGHLVFLYLDIFTRLNLREQREPTKEKGKAEASNKAV